MRDRDTALIFEQYVNEINDKDLDGWNAKRDHWAKTGKFRGEPEPSIPGTIKWREDKGRVEQANTEMGLALLDQFEAFVRKQDTELHLRSVSTYGAVLWKFPDEALDQFINSNSGEEDKIVPTDDDTWSAGMSKVFFPTTPSDDVPGEEWKADSEDDEPPDPGKKVATDRMRNLMNDFPALINADAARTLKLILSITRMITNDMYENYVASIYAEDEPISASIDGEVMTAPRSAWYDYDKTRLKNNGFNVEHGPYPPQPRMSGDTHVSSELDEPLNAREHTIHDHIDFSSLILKSVDRIRSELVSN